MTRSFLRRAWAAALTAAVLVAPAAIAAPTVAAPTPDPLPLVAPPDRPEDPVSHDPTLAKEGDWFYLASTGDAATGTDYIPMRRSKDLRTWEDLPPVFTELPAGVLAAIGATAADAPADAWAPDLSWTGTEWRLYYSVSRFGTTNSVTALATTTSLDPADPDYGWVDRGAVLESEPNSDAFNAIDANVVEDAEGGTWLTFGSFFGGLKIVALDAATGMLAPGAEIFPLVDRQIQFNPVEGPSIIRNGGFYYLFAAFDYCCRGVDSDYRVVVGRSETVTGPYLDKDGVSLLAGGGSEVLRGYNEFQGTGHPDVLSSGGVDYFVNHYYDALSDGLPRLNVRTLSWSDGWPTVSDPVNPSRSAGHGSAYVRPIPRDSDTVVSNATCGYAGADVTLAAPSPTDLCQQWQIDARDAVQVTDGSETGSRFQNRRSNMAADFPGCAEAQTTGDVGQFDWLGSFFYNVCQRWLFAPAADGYTTISSIAGRNLVWTAEGTNPGADLGVATPTGAANQQFRFQPVGEVLLGSATDPTRTLGVAGCKPARGNGNQVRMETRVADSCQTWTMTSTGGAGYTVTNAATGSVLTATSCDRGRAPARLRLLPAGRADATCSAWTLVPGNDGTWTLATTGSAQTVRLLLPDGIVAADGATAGVLHEDAGRRAWRAKAAATVPGRQKAPTASMPVRAFSLLSVTCDLYLCARRDSNPQPSDP
ncbi:family 43 glycosylhydrolase [Cellulomonas sp. ATA003]|uniref:family 43 glycosylhydrolase n=1 Tax=Cellulomonas sp. ATA003 TaxID=3073064 RepID=UPI0028731472|nr:family 43 glycosylhydrolase [Cellulomonas sp. ATA003]WNB85477.1 family 43 glycosylhydrolase [Cellulomonas sp. ATA003]